MQSLSLLLLFAKAVTSTSMTDLWHRDVGVVYYTVYPVDPGNVVATTETEASLKDLDTNASIIPTREDDLLTTWSISSIRSDLQASISAVKGVRHVETEDNRRVLATAGISEPERPLEPARRDIRSYMVLGKNPSDAEEGREVLMVQGPA